MHRDLAELKIEALLHDPPGKTPMLWYRSHERFADELVELVLGRPPRRTTDVRRADRYASAVDRVVLDAGGSSGVDPVRGMRADFLRRPEIVHPVAGTRYDLHSLAQVDPDALAVAQRRAVERLVAAAGGPGADAERLYWHLWRGLPAEVEGAGELGKLWRYLPADTRVPDHPIWDHMRLASAFAGALPEPALLVFSFGPVQSLIAAARRTGDLWAGSFLLSWLAWRAMRPIVTELGADAVLFPDLHGQPLVDTWLASRGWTDIPGWRRGSAVASLPNRFLALVPSADGKRLAQEAETAVQTSAIEFVSESASVLDRVTHGWRERVVAQVATTFVCQWHVLPWRMSEARTGDAFGGEGELRQVTEVVLGPAIRDFWQTRDDLAGRELYRPNLGTFFEPHSRLVEMAHGAAKATRCFAQIEEVGERCRVCGTREALWGREADQEGSAPRAVKKGEWLCAICWGRRHAPRSAWARDHAGGEVIFPSTHTLAASQFFEDVLDRLQRASEGSGSDDDGALSEAVERFVEVTRGADRTYATRRLMRRAHQCGRLRGVAEEFVKTSAELLDAATFDDRSVADGSLKELGLDASRVDDVRAALANLSATCRRIQIRRPGTYYAVLVMDGDHMGQWLSGAKAPVIRDILHSSVPVDGGAWLGRTRPLSSAHQVAVSRALNHFALSVVPPIVEDVHGGVVVYAGGDDVLAMVPLPGLLACLGDLRRLYSGLPLDPESPARRDGWESDRGHVERYGRLFQVMGERATSSVGVAIAHAKWPLRHALDTARGMERLAKSERDRNAVAIALLKRSGGHERFAARWGEGEGIGPFHPLAALDDVRRLIADGVSRRFAYTLREEAPTLWELKDALEERAFWLAWHHRRRATGAPEGTADARRAARGLRELAEAIDRWSQRRGPGTAEPKPLGAVDEFRAAVGLAEFLARGGSE